MSHSYGIEPVVMDVAGAIEGGAARFMRELDAWRAAQPDRRKNTRIIGRNRRLTPQWLLARELESREAQLRIALNNASFWAPFGERIVLLRNALHFCAKSELDALGFKPSPQLRAQIPVIRALAHRADRIVVPCTAMAERVDFHMPRLHARIEVRGHPVSVPAWASDTEQRDNSILVPIVPHPYKNLDRHIASLLAAIGDLDLKVVVTATELQLPLVAGDPRVYFVGRLSSAQLEPYWGRARAIYYPTGLESFGYPLAEARVGGRWIIALETEQNQEIAGAALAPFNVGDSCSLTHAVECAMAGDPRPEPGPNDPDSYFHFLTGIA